MAVEVRPMCWRSIDSVNNGGTGFSDATFLGMLRLSLQGSGAVRDLHEAMSLGAEESLALKTVVECFVSDERKTSSWAA